MEEEEEKQMEEYDPHYQFDTEELEERFIRTFGMDDELFSSEHSDSENRDSPCRSICSFLKFSVQVYIPTMLHIVDIALLACVILTYIQNRQYWYTTFAVLSIVLYRFIASLWIWTVYQNGVKFVLQMLDIQIFVDIYRSVKHRVCFQVLIEIQYIQGCTQNFFNALLAMHYVYHEASWREWHFVAIVGFWLFSAAFATCAHDETAFFSPALEPCCCIGCGQTRPNKCAMPTDTVPCLYISRFLFRFAELLLHTTFFLYLTITPYGWTALVLFFCLFPTLTSIIYSWRTTENWKKSIHYGIISMSSIPTLSSTSVADFWLGEARKLHENKKCEEIARQKNQKRIEVMIKHGEKDNEEITRIFYDEFELDESLMPPDPITSICFKHKPICVVQIFMKIAFFGVVMLPFIVLDIRDDFSTWKRMLLLVFIACGVVLAACLCLITGHLRKQEVDIMNQYIRTGDMFGLENQMSAGVQYNPDLLMQIGEWCWDKRDYTALDMILANGVDFTMKQDEWTLMSLSTVWNRHETVRRLIAYGDDVDQCEEDGITPLYLCGQKGNSECCELLIEAGADPNFLCDNNCGPLYVASELGHLNVIKRLIEAKARVNVVNDAGTTPLAIASMFGYDDIVEHLLEKRADLNFRLPETEHTKEQELVGFTAFQCAEKYDCTDSMTILKQFDEVQNEQKRALGRDW